MLRKEFLLYLFPLLLPFWTLAQTSTLRGVILDQQSEIPLAGATLRTKGLEATLGAMTDADGVFVIRNVPVGRVMLEVLYPGYETQTIPNILVTAGKEVQLNVRLRESLTNLEQVVITAKVDKDRPMNELATLSARQFNKEEVSRYSGGHSAGEHDRVGDAV